MNRAELKTSIDVLLEDLENSFADFVLMKSRKKEDKALEIEAADIINNLKETKGYCNWLIDNYLLDEYSKWISRGLIIKARLDNRQCQLEELGVKYKSVKTV